MAFKIELKHVSKVFGSRPEGVMGLVEQGLGKEEILARTGHTVAVRDATLGIEAGEIFVIMGLSGSGKSTLVRMVNRLIEPNTGEILIDGEDIARMDRSQIVRLRRGHIAMVFQSFALLPHLTVLDNAAFGLDVAGMRRTERLDRAMEALRDVGLEGYAQSRPHELSGGMQQRVGLARALAVQPSILLMDEAFSALDPLIRRGMQEDLVELQEARELTVVFISHDLGEAMRIGDRIAMMADGAVSQVGTAREILEHPAEAYIRDFFQDVDVTQVYAAEHAADPETCVIEVHEGWTPEAVAERLEERGQSYAYLVDDAQRWLGVMSTASLRSAASADLHAALLPDPICVRARTPLGEVLGEVARTPYPVPVVGRRRRFRGAVSRPSLLSTLEKGA